jgi:hypothetical protein
MSGLDFFQGWESSNANVNTNQNDAEQGNDWAQWNSNSQFSRQASSDSQIKVRKILF